MFRSGCAAEHDSRGRRAADQRDELSRDEPAAPVVSVFLERRLSCTMITFLEQRRQWRSLAERERRLDGG
uniref:Uncharacterized protein n=1 Tax=Manihot esculenta TaxID=3983 RepID=A0A2C9VKN5_MANES